MKVAIITDQHFGCRKNSKLFHDYFLKFYNNVADNKHIVEHNYKMMQLYAPQMSVQSKIFVQDAVENFDFSYNKTEIIRMMREDGFGELNWEDLRTNLNRISRENKQ